MIDDIQSKAILNNDLEIPWLGFGTYKIRPGEETVRSVTEALDVGYRHIDTAEYYDNERGVGQAVRGSPLRRDEVFVTTKVWNNNQGYENTLQAFEDSLSRLGMDYVDLYLVHWPVSGKFKETWKALEEICRSDRAKAIGVSNFLIQHLEDLLRSAEIVPAVNQVEFHPHLFQRELLEYCRKRGIQMEAWSPLKKGEVPSIEALQRIGKRYGKTAAQVALRWDLQHGVVTIPKTVHRERMEENSDIFDFQISDEDMELIDSLDHSERVGPDPSEV